MTNELAVEERSLPVYAAGSLEVPFVIGFFQECVSTDTYWPEHSHPTHELLWNVRGVSSVSVDAQTWTVAPSLGIWMPAGTLHSGRAVAGSICNMNHFDVRQVPSISAHPVPVEMSTLLKLLLERLADPNLSERSRRITEAAVLDNLNPASVEVSLCLPKSPILQPIVHSMWPEPSKARSLQFWSDRLGVSTRTISRAFERETGQGYSRWVAAVQAQHAITLAGQGRDLEDVAGILGYGSLSALGAAFKRTTGHTLSEFRVN